MSSGAVPGRAAEPASPLARALRTLLRLQTSRSWTLLLVALGTVLVAGLLASRLKLKTSFGELLPENKESVIVADQVNDRLVAASTLTLVAQGSDPKGLKDFIDTLAPELRALGPKYVGNVDNGVRASREFFKDNQLIYAPLADVQKVHDEIVDRYDYEVAKEIGTNIDDSDAPPPITADSIRARLKRGEEDAKASGPSFPDGYYMEPDEHMIALLIRTPVSSGDIERSKALLVKVEEVIAKVDPKRFDPSMRLGYTGDFITSQEEYLKIKDDLSHVGLVGVAMILGVVFLFYLRIRTLLAMAITVLIGVAWTFGFAYLAIGHLNSSTGFLVSIVVGNGINFGIIYMARYLEARRSQSLDESIVTANRETWLSTMAAAGAAMVAYGSLVVTDFRGFKHFGLIGGAGMVLCWIATYLFLPALLVGFERISAVTPDHPLFAKVRGAYGVPFAWLAEHATRSVALIGIVLGLAGVALTIHYVASNPMEYDMSNTGNEAPKDNVDSSAAQLGRRVDRVVGRQGQDGLAIMTDRVDQVLPLKTILDQRRAEAPADLKPFDKVVTIFDLLPTDQEKKIPLINEAIDKLERAHRRNMIKPVDWDEIEKDVPKKKVAPIGIVDLPEQVARSFIEKDGTRGRLVYIVPATGRSVWDAHYLIQWADSFRRTELPDHSVIKGSGRSVIFADLILTVIEDAPKAILGSLAGTVLIIILAFRAGRTALGVLATLGLGMVWMIAAMALYHAKLVPSGGLVPHLAFEGMKLNFLNFVALPISIGVGADYAVNVMQRYRIVGPGHVGRVIRETGGAVILCSLTTMLGYLALTFSVNKAIESFGYAAAAGEISCVLAAVLVLPAFLVWRDRRNTERAKSGGTANAEPREKAA